MSNKPSAVWYLAPIFLGIIGSGIMWYVLKDDDHPDAPKMVKKGWIIGIVLTLIDFAWLIPFMLIPFAFMGFDDQQMQQQVPEPVQRMIPEQTTEQITQSCSGNAGCFTGIVTRVIDGDTIHVDGSSIRFALVDTPEVGQVGFNEAKNFVANTCPVGSEALVDEDDGQPRDIYDRIIATIYCNGVNLNEAILEQRLGYLISGDCDRSEFSNTWAQQGCRNMIQEIPVTETTPQLPIEQPTQTIESSCDPSYPDVCIPSQPPDLDCSECWENWLMITKKLLLKR